jgi:hypothetical protein
VIAKTPGKAIVWKSIPCDNAQGTVIRSRSLPTQPRLSVYLDSLGHQFTWAALAISLPRQPWLAVYMDNLLMNILRKVNRLIYAFKIN